MGEPTHTNRRWLQRLTILSCLLFGATCVLQVVLLLYHGAYLDEIQIARIGDTRFLSHGRALYVHHGELMAPVVMTTISGNYETPIDLAFLGFRCIYRVDAGQNITIWTIRIPTLPLFVISLILPCFWLVRRSAATRADCHLSCRKCGYDLRASADKCPECGDSIPEKNE